MLVKFTFEEIKKQENRSKFLFFTHKYLGRVLGLIFRYLDYAISMYRKL